MIWIVKTLKVCLEEEFLLIFDVKKHLILMKSEI